MTIDDKDKTIEFQSKCPFSFNSHDLEYVIKSTEGVGEQYGIRCKTCGLSIHRDSIVFPSRLLHTFVKMYMMFKTEYEQRGDCSDCKSIADIIEVHELPNL